MLAMNQDTHKYQDYVKGRSDISLFMQPWWLDTWSAQGNWGVCLSEKKGTIQGAMVYDQSKKYGLTTITNAPISPYAGPHIQSGLSLSSIDEVILGLSAKIPKAGYTRLKLSPTSVLSPAWHWNNYQCEGLMTLTIDLSADLSTIYSNYSSSLRNEIKKSEVEIKDISAEDFYTFYQDTHKAGSPARLHISLNKWIAAINKSEGNISLRAAYHQEELAGVVAIVHDHSWSHYLLSASSEKSGNSLNSTAQLLHHTISLSKERGASVFNMEGSMIKGIYSFMRKFGCARTPVYVIESKPTLAYRSAQSLKRLIR